MDVDSADWEQADKRIRKEARRRIFFFMGDWNQCPAGVILLRLAASSPFRTTVEQLTLRDNVSYSP